MNEDIVLHVENVTMQFGGVVAVNNLSLDVPKGKIIALIGPNGAGKTTAFNCITGVYEPTNGLITFNGEPIVRNHPVGAMKKTYAGLNADRYTSKFVLPKEFDESDDAYEKRKEALKEIDKYAFTDTQLAPTADKITNCGIARTFQNIRLWKSMTVFDNVLTAKHMRAKQNLFSATFRTSIAEENRMKEETVQLLEEQNLFRFKDDLATSLPYGLQRRLEIARALATNPTLLLLDEPAAGMTPQETVELCEFIKEIRNKYNLSVFLIEHHMDLVMQISDYIYVIDFGSEIAQGVPKDIQTNQAVINAYLGADNE
jgi:branched-chain amino acid transport system ATP-binding protein